MGVCCFISKSNYESMSLGNSGSVIQSKYNYKNESHFYGYPNYLELIEALAQILSQQKKGWILYQETLMKNKIIIQIYRKFLQALQINIKRYLLHQIDSKQICEIENIQLAHDFNLNFQNSLVVELQNIDIYQISHFMPFELNEIAIQIVLNYKKDGIDAQTSFQCIERPTIVDSINVYKLNLQPDEEQLENSGDIVYDQNIFQEAQFTIKILCKNIISGEIQQIGRQATFNLRDCQDQRLTEKNVRIFEYETENIICEITMRFQLLYNLSTFIKWWIEELNERNTQIEIILKKIEEVKLCGPSFSQTLIAAGESENDQSRRSENSMRESYQPVLEIRKRFDSLLSYDGNSLRSFSKSRISVYELPFLIK